MQNHRQKLIDVRSLNAQKIRSILEQAYIETKPIDKNSEFFVYKESELIKSFKFRLNPSLDFWVNMRVEENRIALCDELIMKEVNTPFESLVMFINKLNEKYAMVKTYTAEIKEVDVIVIFIAYEIFYSEQLSIPDFIFQIRKFMHMHQIVVKELSEFLY